MTKEIHCEFYQQSYFLSLVIQEEIIKQETEVLLNLRKNESEFL